MAVSDQGFGKAFDDVRQTTGFGERQAFRGYEQDSQVDLILRYPGMVWRVWRNFPLTVVLHQCATKTHPCEQERPGTGAGNAARELPGRSVRSFAHAVVAGVLGVLCGAQSLVGVLVDTVKVLT
jgi:hypothetical protein